MQGYSERSSVRRGGGGKEIGGPPNSKGLGGMSLPIKAGRGGKKKTANLDRGCALLKSFERKGKGRFGQRFKRDWKTWPLLLWGKRKGEKGERHDGVTHFRQRRRKRKECVLGRW